MNFEQYITENDEVVKPGEIGSKEERSIGSITDRMDALKQKISSISPIEKQYYDKIENQVNAKDTRLALFLKIYQYIYKTSNGFKNLDVLLSDDMKIAMKKVIGADPTKPVVLSERNIIYSYKVNPESKNNIAVTIKTRPHGNPMHLVAILISLIAGDKKFSREATKYQTNANLKMTAVYGNVSVVDITPEEKRETLQRVTSSLTNPETNKYLFIVVTRLKESNAWNNADVNALLNGTPTGN